MWLHFAYLCFVNMLFISSGEIATHFLRHVDHLTTDSNDVHGYVYPEELLESNQSQVVSFLGVLNYSKSVLTFGGVTRDLTAHVCGTNNFCNHSIPQRNASQCALHCTECQCDEACHYFGDCCPDELFRYSEFRASVKPEFMSCKGEKRSQWLNQSHIFIVTKCPQNFQSNESTKTKCESPDKRSLEESTPVSDVETYVSYVNMFCAECHGVQRFRPWSQDVQCSAETDLSGAKTKEELWYLLMTQRLCFPRIRYIPPDVSLLRPCISYEINRCNVTGAWKDNIDPQIEELCELFNYPIMYYGDSKFGVAYSNIFCAVCNGASLSITTCLRTMSPISYPISVLLHFNPQEKSIESTSESFNRCGSNDIYDPILMECREIKCPPRRVLKSKVCDIPYLSVHGIGFRIRHIVSIYNVTSVNNLSLFIGIYRNHFNAFFENFKPFLYTNMTFAFFQEDINTFLVDINIDVVSGSNKSVVVLEHSTRKFKTLNSTQGMAEENIKMKSACLQETISENLTLINRLEYHKQPEYITTMDVFFGEEVFLDCPYLEYDFIFEGFTVNPNTSILDIKGKEISLNKSRVMLCGNKLKICIDSFPELQLILGAGSSKPAFIFDSTLSILSLVCVISSLLGLFFTFSVYCMVSTLRTTPGKNTMALIFHLFCAQLLFLTFVSRVEQRLLCQVFAILIHYFWLATFTWTMGSAYQVCVTFSGCTVMASQHKQHHKLPWKYASVCNTVPLLPVGVCLGYYLTITEGRYLGYGNTICFLEEPWAMGVFFAAPLILMLVFNTVCFIRTLHANGCRSRVENCAINTGVNLFYFYIKLSILFGLSWMFGILAAIFSSKVLWYIFEVLTASQGVFIFIVYCANLKTVKSIKKIVSKMSSSLSRVSPKLSSEDTTSSTAL